MALYKRWSEVPGYLRTKIQLERIGLRPKFIDCPDGVINYYSGNSYKRYPLYDIEQCVPLENYTVSIDHIEVTTEILAEALYVINKFAKRKRDHKKEHYYSGQFHLVNLSKKREQEIYNLKGQVLVKMLEQQRAEILGIHRQTVKDHMKSDSVNYLVYIKAGEYTFHRPAKAKDIKKHKFLGDINIISAEMNTTSLSIMEAVMLLEKYMSEPCQQFEV
ncbi:YkyB family protein [Desulforamulus aquiferis]|uniref:YkyB family protein n=1 Tax=Desulforamulus aquiferis TaxID=1397668 RepID=A0AAW7ZB15_9FIRM|nr:YkyB family protein [Desulforamulus aquiferis]MDO7786532.1 YkyB family protein [Desulforamulus aquiferis]RYD03704.1 hypothetical protein N752_18320 [Desulforamulus aquiferis]